MAGEFTYPQLGALLIAVGTEMSLRNLCAPAALDGDSDEQLVETMRALGIDEEIARKLLDVDLTTAIDIQE